MRRLFLHIGVQRTGTTSIQNVLHDNRDALHRQGVHYAFDTPNHTGLAWALANDKLDADRFIEDVHQDAVASGCDTSIISGEDFCFLEDVAALEGLRRHFDVTVIVYLRRQDEWLESWYNQHVKWPWDPQLSRCDRDEFFDRRGEFFWIDYARTLARWREVFGRDNIVVRVYERDRHSGGLVEDFCEACGIDTTRLATTGDSKNLSTSPKTTELLRHLDLIDKPGPQRQTIVNSLRIACEKAGWGNPRHLWSGARRRALIGEFADSNREVAREYLGRIDGVLFPAPLPVDDSTEPDIALPATGELFESVINPVVRMMAKRAVKLERDLESGGATGVARRVAGIVRPMGEGKAPAALLELLEFNRLPRPQRRLLLDFLRDCPDLDSDDVEAVADRWIEPLLGGLSRRLNDARTAQNRP